MYLMATVKIKYPSILTKAKEKMKPNTNREIRTAPLSSRHIKKKEGIRMRWLRTFFYWFGL